jgi:site-specific recombinase XerD
MAGCDRDRARRWAGYARHQGDDLACYLGWLADQNGGAGLALAEVTREHIASYLAHPDDVRSYAEATIGHRRSIVRTLQRLLIAEGVARHDHMVDIAADRRRGRPAARDGARPSG